MPATKLMKLMRREPRRKGGRGTNAAMIDEKRIKAMDLRLQNMTYRQIADKIGVSVRTAYDYVHHAHEKKLFALTQKADVIRDEENEAYDQLLARWMPLALSEEIKVLGIKENKKGEAQIIDIESWEVASTATDKVIKLLEGKAKINGLNTIKVEAKGEFVLPQSIFAAIQLNVQSLKEGKNDVVVDAEFETHKLEDKK